jgi:hypothetical protein
MKNIHILLPKTIGGDINTYHASIMDINIMIMKINNLFGVLKQKIDIRNKAKLNTDNYIIYLINIINVQSYGQTYVYKRINNDDIDKYYKIMESINDKLLSNRTDQKIKKKIKNFDTNKYVFDLIYEFIVYLKTKIFCDGVRKAIIIDECGDNVKLLFYIFNHFKNDLDNFIQQ